MDDRSGLGNLCAAAQVFHPVIIDGWSIVKQNLARAPGGEDIDQEQNKQWVPSLKVVWQLCYCGGDSPKTTVALATSATEVLRIMDR
jgi:hypothetical protein